MYGLHTVLLPIAIMLGAAKLSSEFFERILKQPAVLAEILVGILLGSTGFGWIDGRNEALAQIGQIGAVFLLFEIGLESDLDELFKAGLEALFVAAVGVLLTFGFGFLVTRALGQPVLASLFVGAAVSATSIGISARVLADLGVLQSREARIVLTAAVADDVIGLIILAAVSGLAATGVVSWTSVGQTSLVAVAFLVTAVYLGLKGTPILLKFAKRMRTRAAISSVAVVFCLFLAGLSETAQLAPIVGAFAAGLVLAKTESKVHFEGKIRNISEVFVPLFFVLMGVRAEFRSFSLTALVISGSLFGVAAFGKVIAAVSLPFRGINRWLIGFGMIPRGEVGLIFASIGLQRGILRPDLYAAIILVVVATTFVTPPLLRYAVSQKQRVTSGKA
jgi:Kef-type K+ transport system membrane component KefB